MNLKRRADNFAGVAGNGYLYANKSVEIRLVGNIVSDSSPISVYISPCVAVVPAELPPELLRLGALDIARFAVHTEAEAYGSVHHNAACNIHIALEYLGNISHGCAFGCRAFNINFFIFCTHTEQIVPALFHVIGKVKFGFVLAAVAEYDKFFTAFASVLIALIERAIVHLRVLYRVPSCYGAVPPKILRFGKAFKRRCVFILEFFRFKYITACLCRKFNLVDTGINFCFVHFRL